MKEFNLNKTLLVVEPDFRLREAFQNYFGCRGYDIVTCETLDNAAALRDLYFDFAVIEASESQVSLFEFLQTILGRNPSCRAALLTRYPRVATAVRAMKLGVHDYLIKPISVKAVEQALLSSGVSSHKLDHAFPSLARQERDYIEHVLEQSGGNISEAARRLGIHRQSLQRKLRKYPPSR